MTNTRRTKDGVDLTVLKYYERLAAPELKQYDKTMVSLSRDLKIPQMIRCKEVLYQTITMWLSAGGTSSVLHQDDADNLLMVVKGTKDVLLIHQQDYQGIYADISPISGTSAIPQDSVDLVKFPRFGDVRKLKGRLLAGDILYIPHSYWHQVVSHADPTDNRNIALNVWWGMSNDFRWWHDSLSPKFWEENRVKYSKTDKCTPLDPDSRFSDVSFIDENVFKSLLMERRKIWAKQNQRKSKKTTREKRRKHRKEL